MLTSKLEVMNLESFYAPLIDMYSNKAIEDTLYNPGMNPLDLCPFFDKTGYKVDKYMPQYDVHIIRGGVRQRVFNKDNFSKSPALNKTPLIKWKEHFAYIDSTHIVLPSYLNTSYNNSLPSGALLHFKFLHNLPDKIAIELKEKQHWNNSYEYQQYHKFLENKKSLFDMNVSQHYKNPNTLEKLGLINKGNNNVCTSYKTLDNILQLELTSDINWYTKKIQHYQKNIIRLQKTLKQKENILSAIQTAISQLIHTPFKKKPYKKYIAYKDMLKTYYKIRKTKS